MKKEHGNYSRAFGYIVSMVYAMVWAYFQVIEHPETKAAIAFLFIGWVVALTAVYCVLSRKD